jgi:phage repressor protein C with HTH and peptisase S24 domain
MKSLISDRIKLIINELGYNNNSFSKAIGLTNNVTIGRIVNENREPSYDILLKIMQTFGSINGNWLITGIGNPFTEGNLNNAEKSGIKGNLKGNLTGNLIGKSIPKSIPKSITKVLNIPITDISVAAGAGALNNDHFEVVDSIQLPENLVKKGVYLCVRIKGESMAPTLQDGGFLIIRLLDKSEWEKQADERIYVVSDNEGNTYVKRLKLRVKKGFVICKSDNPDRFLYPSFNIQVNDINTLWYAEWYLSAKMPNIHDQYYTRLQRLEDDVDEMKAKFKQIKL